MTCAIYLKTSLFILVDGGWSEFEPVGNCSEHCFQKFQRECDNPPPKFEGTCDGANIEYRPCNDEDCPSKISICFTLSHNSFPFLVDCLELNVKYVLNNLEENILEENSFPKCQKLCQNSETCVGYSFKHNGHCKLKKKLGIKYSANGQASAPKHCPIHGNWTDYEMWLPCKNGQQKGFRYCRNPEPEHGGDICEGENYTFKNCTMPEGRVFKINYSSKLIPKSDPISRETKKDIEF